MRDVRSIVGSVVLAVIPVLLMGILVLSGAVARADQAPAATPPEVERLIGLAHAWLGGAERVRAVRSLELVTDGETHRVLFPDRYRVDIDGGATIRAFDGKVLRTHPPRDPARRGAFGPSGPTSSPDEVRTQGLRAVATYALRYVVRVLPTYPMSAQAGEGAACTVVPGACLEFRHGSDQPIVMVLDPVSGQPLAMVTQIVQSGGPGVALWVSRFEEYREVDGLRVPFRIGRQLVTPGGPPPTTPAYSAYDAIRVNPPLADDVFMVLEP